VLDCKLISRISGVLLTTLGSAGIAFCTVIGADAASIVALGIASLTAINSGLKNIVAAEDERFSGSPILQKLNYRSTGYR